jgi:hypothetical protein
MTAYKKQTITLLQSWYVSKSSWPMFAILTTFSMMVINIFSDDYKKLNHTAKCVSKE